MFDVGFWELVLIAGVALMVLGPERLPRAASSLGRWVGRARTLARGLQAQVRRELELEEQRLAVGPGAARDDKSPGSADDNDTAS